MPSKQTQKQIVVSDAEFSKDGLYRHKMWRFFTEIPTRVILYIMLNPSVASVKDKNHDDYTTKKLISFTNKYKYDGFIVCNLCTFISTDHKNIKDKPFLTQDNMDMISSTLELPYVKQVVYAWGSNFKQTDKIQSLNQLLKNNGHPPYCWDVCKNNAPIHPRNLSYNNTLKPYLDSYDKNKSKISQK